MEVLILGVYLEIFFFRITWSKIRVHIIHGRALYTGKYGIKVYEIATTTVSRYLKRQGDFPTMVSILYRCPHFHFPRVYSLRTTFVDHCYSLIQARKERLKSQKITKFNGLTRRRKAAV